MTPDAREQARHNASVMIAFAEGKTVRARPKNTKTWLPFENFPEWNFEEVEYEVKPEERKPLEVELWIDDATETIHNSKLLATMRRAVFREVLPSENTGGQDD